MDQKNLQRMFFGFIAAVVVLAVFLLNHQIKQKKRQQSTGDSANVVSYIEDGDLGKKPQKKPHQVININSVKTTASGKERITDDSKKLSYLDVYKQLQISRVCQTFYTFWRNNDLEADVTKVVRRPQYFYGQQEYAQSEQVPLTIEQSDSLKYWVNQCYGLWEDYGVFDSDKPGSIPLNDVIETISSKLLSMVPKTPKEMDLKQTLQMAAQWTASYQQLESALEGEDSLDLSAASELYDELEVLQGLDDEIKAEWFDAQSNDLPDADALRDQHFDLLRQIRVLEQHIKEQKVVNHEKLAQAEINFQSHDQAMNLALRTQDGDVFFEIIYALNGRQTFLFNILGYSHQSNHAQPAKQYQITPDQLVYETSGQNSSISHQWELRYAFQLYLCDLGWDCGPKSPVIMNYCLVGFGSYPDACGKDLPSFYQEHLISPNRWHDVLKFKSLYKELFYE